MKAIETRNDGVLRPSYSSHQAPMSALAEPCFGAGAWETAGRGMIDPHMSEARITSYRDGPLIVRGPFVLEDQDGQTIETGRETIALCRCGKSRKRPFCDGTHRLVRFRAPSGAESGRETGVVA